MPPKSAGNLGDADDMWELRSSHRSSAVPGD